MSMRELFWRLFQVSGNVEAYLTYSTFATKLEESKEGAAHPATGKDAGGRDNAMRAEPATGERG